MAENEGIKEVIERPAVVVGREKDGGHKIVAKVTDKNGAILEEVVLEASGLDEAVTDGQGELNSGEDTPVPDNKE